MIVNQSTFICVYGKYVKRTKKHKWTSENQVDLLPRYLFRHLRLCKANIFALFNNVGLNLNEKHLKTQNFSQNCMKY